METVVTFFNDIVWSAALVILLVVTGLYFSIRMRLFQVRYIVDMVRLMFKGGKSTEGISSFQAIAVSLAGRVGTGNIVGVATAIFIGGPGAVFWMWLIAFLGAGSAFVESTLAQIYKQKEDGQYRGGPAYYIEKGIGGTFGKYYALLFAVVTVLACGLLLPGIQSNSISSAATNAFPFIESWMIGLFLIIILAVVIFGGIRSIANVATAAVPKSICDILEQKLTEVMTLPLDDQEGHLAPGAAAKLKDTIEKYDIVAIGPGIGRDSGITQILSVVLDSTKPCVIDADALYALKPLLYKAKKREMPVIITPHPGEMSMLSQQSIPYILENSSKVALSFAGENNIITVLKTERTLIADPDGSLYINTTGNPGMAKAGSGDVLTGIISGLYAQGLSAKEAAILGVYLHGRSGDIMKSKLSDYAILPSDILKGVEEVFLELK